MHKPRGLEKFRPDINACTLCGLCDSACPVFALTGAAADGPRGKMALLRAHIAGKIAGAEIASSLCNCASCRRCLAACPEGLPLDLIFLTARFDCEKSAAKNFWRCRARGALWRRPRLFNVLQPFMALGLKLRQKRAKARFALPLELWPVNFGKTGPEENRPKILLFAGCISRRVYTDLTRASVQALSHQGYSVILLKDESCCGRPFMAAGMASDTLALARHNLARIRKHKFTCLVTPCPGCLDSIRNIWPALEGLNDGERKFSQALASSALDINAFIAQKIDPQNNQHAAGESFAWHKPCLLDGAAEAAAKKLLANAGRKIVNVEGDCCCSGGLNVFCLPGFAEKEQHGSNSACGLAERQAMLLRDAIMAKATSAVTACPWCMLALDNAFGKARDKIGPAHSIELYAASLRDKN